MNNKHLSLDSLAKLIGEHCDSPPIQLHTEKDSLILTVEPDLEEGEPISSHFEAKPLGYCLGCKDEVANHVFIYLEPRDGYSAFPGSLIQGLSAASDKAAVRSLLGEPEKSGEPSYSRILGLSGAWDRFIVGTTCIHFQYTLDGNGIALITLMSPDRTP